LQADRFGKLRVTRKRADDHTPSRLDS
jgi:hypothetical protein